MIQIALAAVIAASAPTCPADWEPDMLPARVMGTSTEAVRRLYTEDDLEEADFSADLRAQFRWDQGRDPNWQDFEWLWGLPREPEPECMNVRAVVEDADGRGQVLVTLQNGGVPIVREFAMVDEDGWKIDDIVMEPEAWTLREYLAVDPAIRQYEAPGDDQRRGPPGVGASDGIAEMTTNLYAAAEGGEAPRRYLSADLQRLFADDAIREWNRVNFDWLHGGQEAAVEITGFRAAVLNVSPAMDGHGATAPTLVSFMNGQTEVHRRFYLEEADGYWVVDDVCLFPEELSLEAVLDGREDPSC